MMKTDRELELTGDSLFTEEEAALFLKVSTKTLQRRRYAGMIGFCRISGRSGIRYRSSHLKAYLDACEVAARCPPPPPPRPKYRPFSRKAEENAKALLEII